MSPISPGALAGAFHERELRWFSASSFLLLLKNPLVWRGNFLFCSFSFSCPLERMCLWAPPLRAPTCPSCPPQASDTFPSNWKVHLNKLKWEKRTGSNQGIFWLGIKTSRTCSPPDEWSELVLRWQQARPVCLYLKNHSSSLIRVSVLFDAYTHNEGHLALSGRDCDCWEAFSRVAPTPTLPCTGAMLTSPSALPHGDFGQFLPYMIKSAF